MEAIRLHTSVGKNGSLQVRGLPLPEGEPVEMIVLSGASSTAPSTSTARRLLNSKLIGLWKERTDIADSAHFARKLREQAQSRPRD